MAETTTIDRGFYWHLIGCQDGLYKFLYDQLVDENFDIFAALVREHWDVASVLQQIEKHNARVRASWKQPVVVSGRFLEYEEGLSSLFPLKKKELCS